jgi:uncharacterized membrane protein affecting hemolysin expression
MSGSLRLFTATPQASKSHQEILAMKKLMTLMLGLSLALGSVAVVLAQDTTAKKSSKKKTAKKAPKKAKKDTTEKK